MRAIDIARSPQCMHLGDVWYLPTGELSIREIRLLGRKARESAWFQGLLRSDMKAGHMLPMMCTHVLCWEYRLKRPFAKRGEETEPAWMQYLTPREQGFVRYMHMVAGDQIEPLANVLGGLEYAGIQGYIVEEERMAERVTRAFNLWRLHGVKQLGSLTPPVVGGGPLQAVAMPYSHTRYVHSWDVYAVGRLMAEILGLNTSERRHLFVALISHDTLTPAISDSVKRLNPKAFDEDANYQVLYNRPEWPALRDKYQLSEKLLFEVIQGKGKLRRLLDLADKVAYVARDTWMFLQRITSPVEQRFKHELRLIRSLVSKPYPVCGIWDSVSVVDGVVVIEDAKRLTDFLTLRALMFRVLYYNPASRFFEDTFAKICISYLLQEGIVTPTSLLAMKDTELEDLVDRVSGRHWTLNQLEEDYEPRTMAFETREEALKHEAEILQSNAEVISTLEEMTPGTNPGTKNFDVIRVGKVMPFVEAFPAEAARINNIMRIKKPFRVYWFTPRKEITFPSKIVRRLRAERMKRAG